MRKKTEIWYYEKIEIEEKYNDLVEKVFNVLRRDRAISIGITLERNFEDECYEIKYCKSDYENRINNLAVAIRNRVWEILHLQENLKIIYQMEKE